MVLVVNVCGYFPTANSSRKFAYSPPLDTSSSLAAPYMALYFFYGFQDGVFQAFAFWVIGALSNDPYVLATYSGLYKTFAALGAVIVFTMDARKVSFMKMWGSDFGVLIFGCICLGPLVFYRVRDTELITREEVAETTKDDTEV